MCLLRGIRPPARTNQGPSEHSFAQPDGVAGPGVVDPAAHQRRDLCQPPSPEGVLTDGSCKATLKVDALPPFQAPAVRKHDETQKLYRHGFLGQPGECIHAAVVSANARRTTAGARKPSRSINHCWL